MIKLVMARESGDDEFTLDYGPDIKYQETREPTPEEINLEPLADPPLPPVESIHIAAEDRKLVLRAEIPLPEVVRLAARDSRQQTLDEVCDFILRHAPLRTVWPEGSNLVEAIREHFE